jgi:preprotein translocase subunit SecE
MSLKFEKIVAFFKDARKELSKVVWPSKRDIAKHTVIVISISLVLAAIFGVFDTAFAYFIQMII